MKMNKIGFAFVLGFGISACGAGTTTTADAGPDAASVIKTDTATPDVVAAVPVYDMVSIVDMETTRDLFVCSATNGPGSDIDAVALIRGVATVGYGLIGSAKFFVADPATSKACAAGACSGTGGDCKYSSVSGKFTATDLVARTEGKPDAIVNKSTDDVGYFSINGGALQIMIGDQTGSGVPQTFLSGDQIKVLEVDQTYVTATNGCVCSPEHYAVYIQDSTGVGADILLAANEYSAANATVCGAAPGATDYGCGTTTFVIP